MIETLSVASEIYPLIKTGGLADVVGALPTALAAHDTNMRTLVPGYRKILAQVQNAHEVASWPNYFGGPARLLASRTADMDLIVLDAPHLYDRDGGPYGNAEGLDWPDNWQRFAALSRAGAEIGQGLIKGYRPDILHAHDWQAALVPAYIAFGPPSPVKTVLTIHNLAFQGNFDGTIFPELGLPDAANTIDGVEYYGGVGFLKAGINLADAITTVSPTYASEIRTDDYGMGLEGLLVSRAHHLTGILNGIDNAVWNPETDPALAANFKPRNLEDRLANKRAIESRFGLHEGQDGILFGLVSRLTWQKGIDLLIECIDELVGSGARLCVLGSGEKALEQALRDAVARHPGRVGVVFNYDEPLSHLIQAGADAILVPSRFEPCGLTQMFALRYGAIPLVARVGGLADSVIDANDAALACNAATGVQFSPVTRSALSAALVRTMNLYAQPKVWAKMQRNAMKADFGWQASAGRYAELYRHLIENAA